MFLSSGCLGQQFTVEIYRHEVQGGHTNVWRVSSAMLANVPQWKLGTEPPLSLAQAIEIARTNVLFGEGNTNLWIAEIAVRPVFPGAGTFGNVYYYNIRFGGASYIGHYRRCIVLMDGTVVKPDWFGTKPKTIGSWSYYE